MRQEVAPDDSTDWRLFVILVFAFLVITTGLLTYQVWKWLKEANEDGELTREEARRAVGG